jgi:DNA-binding CsgD family transcriptional regulator
MSRFVVAAIFAAITVLAAVDLTDDLGGGTGVFHVVAEGLVVLLGTAGVALVLWQLRAARRRTGELVRGVGEAIERQFATWHLTGAEREVAMLLLKGLSHRAIADARQVSEATARQQAQAVYRKAGVAGRGDLAAFFLEDLLPPIAER